MPKVEENTFDVNQGDLRRLSGIATVEKEPCKRSQIKRVDPATYEASNFVFGLNFLCQTAAVGHLPLS